MRPVAVIGTILIVAGLVVLALRGVSYTKERHAVRVGSFEVAAEQKGFVPPAVGIIAIVAGVALVAVGRRRAE